MMRSIRLRVVLGLVFALAAASSTDVFAQKWQGITEAENRIVFTGRRLDGYRALHYFHPFDESDFSHQHYRALWTAGSRRLPIFLIDLYILPPGRHYSHSVAIRLNGYVEHLSLFKDKPVSTVDTGTVETALGPAEFLIFTAGKHRCGVSSLYYDDGAIDHPDTLGNTHVTGLYCPVSAQVDAATLESLLARVGIRGIAVPETEGPRAGPSFASGSAKALAALVASGNIKGLRRAAVVTDFDPDTLIPFQHPRFARGRVISRPVLVAAAVFGRTEMVVFLLNKGASTRGLSGGAICAAIARRHPRIVDVLLKKDPELRHYNRCGRSQNLSPIQLAQRLDIQDIVDKLRESDSR